MMRKKRQKEPGTPHVTVKIPKELIMDMDRLIGSHGFRSRGEIAKEAIRQLLNSYQNILPIFEVLNHDQNGVKVYDREQHRVADVIFKPEGIRCLLCESDICPHINFVFQQPTVREILRKKRLEGWKIPDF